jgi:hypothetical protein
VSQARDIPKRNGTATPRQSASSFGRFGERMEDINDRDLTSVDQMLDRLRSPTTVHDRFGILQCLVNYWHGPIRPEDGMSDAEIGSVPLPLPLRWWYRWAGKRANLISGQNILLAPRDYENKHRMISIRNGRLFFYAESQGVYQWSTLPQGDDPPVFGRYEGRGRWAEEGLMLSEHLILMCLFEAVMCHADYGASAAWLDAEQLGAIAETIPPLAIPPWRWLRTQFFVRKGAFMHAAPNGEVEGRKGYSVWIGAKTREPLQFLRAHLNDRWEYVAL